MKRQTALAILLAAALGAAFSSCQQSGEYVYTIEQIVGFGTGGSSELFKKDGWAQADRFSSWTVGPRATLKFNVSSENRPLGVRMRLAALHKPPELPFQTVEVIANGTKVAEWQVARMGDFTAVIPLDVLQKEPGLRIDLLLPQATAPKSLGLSPDPRPLGVSCFEMQITKAVSLAEMWPDQFPREATPGS